jgi:hypothetical protein
MQRRQQGVLTLCPFGDHAIERIDGTVISRLAVVAMELRLLANIVIDRVVED